MAYDPRDPLGWRDIRAALNRDDPYNWQGIAAGIESGEIADPNRFYDINADPFGVAQYMTPQFPGEVSTSKWNYGQEQPADIGTMSTQGNAIQDYYQILANPVTQWLNMATTGNAPFDLNALMQSRNEPSQRVVGLLNSDNEYLQSAGQQLVEGAAPETIKLQFRTVDTLAQDPETLKVYDSAVDEAYREQAEKKLTGPAYEFEKMGLTNPLQQYTADTLPGDAAADRADLTRRYGTQGDTAEDWQEYAKYQRSLAKAMQAEDEMLSASIRYDPYFGVDEKTGAAKGQVGGKLSYGVPQKQRAIDPRNQHIYESPSGEYVRENVKYDAGGVSDPKNARGRLPGVRQRGQTAKGEATRADRMARGPRPAPVQDIERGLNAVRAWQLGQQGRTPARDQARAMLSWLSSMNYG